MLDMDFIVQNPDVVKRAIEVKQVDLDLDRLLALHGEVKALLGQVEELRHERNVLSKQTGSASAEEREGLIERSREVGSKIKDLEPSLRERQEQLQPLLLEVPNIPGADEPIGENEEGNVELRKEGEPPQFEFTMRDHIELLEVHDWAEFGRVGKVAGPRSYALKGQLLLLEMALWRFALDFTQERGFTLIGLPAMAKEAAFAGTGHFPHGRADVYQVADDLFLSGTAEVGLNALHSDEILSAGDLPLRYGGFSTCFRREAGAAGRDVRGLLRVHQFYKVEQYICCAADKDESAHWFETLLANGEAIVQALELPYRIMRLCTGDMGAGKVRTWDIECWIPSQEQYRETHSVSEYYDWQARRSDLRYRDEEGKVRHAYTLNNTALATPRILVPLLEVHQQEDGTVRVPEALRPYVGGVETLGEAG
ncbi:MAG: serine--tRNA ligase [Chloroflexi bacterium]|nr:serine--tRNA ligase [Chloroflexota bacterium]